MTTIIALKHKDGITIGADSRATLGDFAVDTDSGKWFLKNEIWWGFCGLGALGGVVRAFAHWENDDKKDPSEDLLVNAIKAARKAVSEELEQHNEHWGAMVVYRGELYFVDPHWSCVPVPMLALGSGGAYAMGAAQIMLNSAEPETPENIVKRALSAASMLDPATGGALQIVTVKQ